MEKGFKKYYKEGFKSSLMALKGFGIFKYQLLMLINLLGKILIIPSPIVSLVNVRVIKNTRITKKISITNSLQGFDHPISFWSLMISKIMSLILFLGIVLLIVLLTSILFFFGLMISSFINDTGVTAILFSVPGGLLLLAFIISIPYIYIPVKYVIDSNPQITFSKTMYNALYSLKQGGKKTVFLNALVFYSILVGIGGICFLIPALAFSYLPNELIGIACLLLALMISVFIFVMPMFSLTYSIVKQNLYEDLLVDTYSGVKELTGINPKIMKNARKNGDIASLFDTIDYDDFVIEEDEEEVEDQLLIDEYLTLDSSNQNEEEIKSDQEEPTVLNEELLSEEKMENSNEEPTIEDPFDEVLTMASNEEKPKKSLKDILGKLKPKKKTKANESEDLKENEEKLEKSNEESDLEDLFDEDISIASNEEKPKKSFKDILGKLKPKKKDQEELSSEAIETPATKEPTIKDDIKEDPKTEDIPKEEASKEETPEVKVLKETSIEIDSSLKDKKEVKTENIVNKETSNEKVKEELEVEKEISIEVTGELESESLSKEINLEHSIPEEMTISPIEDIKTETKEEVLFDDSQFEEYLSDLLEENSKKVGE